jgi:alpha-L-fucosidase
VTGTGTGLVGQYWANSSFSGTPVLTRTDPTLNFAWRFTGSPASTIPAGTYSVRWTGTIQPQYSEAYTVLVVSGGSVQVWIDGKKIISDTTQHDAAVDKATVTLKAGTRYPIRVEYADNKHEGYLKLLWYAPDAGQRTVPTSQLYPS